MVSSTPATLTWQLCQFVHVCLQDVSPGYWLVAAACVCLASIATCAACGCCRWRRHVRPRKVLQLGLPVLLLCLLGLRGRWGLFSDGLLIRVGPPSGAFEARLEAALQGKDTLTAAQIAAAEDQILSFEVPHETVVILEVGDQDGAGVPLVLRRWMSAHTERCPRCRLLTSGRASAAERQRSRVKLLLGCPTAASGEIVRDHPEQVLVCGCGEAPLSKGGLPYFRSIRGQQAGVALCDYATSFRAPRGADGTTMVAACVRVAAG
jgi:hypothetical protein